jgi:metallo-beta-lactamase class B
MRSFWSVLFALGLGPAAVAQTVAPPDAAALAKDPVLFLSTAQKALRWNEPADPVHIVGPIWFVGTRGLASWLITTPEGHILLNTTMPSGAPLIAESIRKAGFRVEDVRILLAGHAHSDHAGGHSYIQKLSQARVVAIAEEVPLLESGGKTDFHYGAYPEFYYDPVKVDQVIRDGETIQLADVALTAMLNRGHTKGATTYLTRVVDHGKVYTVVFPNGTSINPGYRLVREPSYPGIADDFRRSLHLLEMLRPDIWLDAHTDVFGFEEKRARAAREGVVAWVDPEGYRKWLLDARAKLEATIDRELAGSP